MEAVDELLDRGMSSMLVWVLEANPYMRFYDRMGGVAVDKKSVEIAAREHVVVEYGWRDLVKPESVGS